MAKTFTFMTVASCQIHNIVCVCVVCVCVCEDEDSVTIVHDYVILKKNSAGNTEYTSLASH